MCECDQVKGKKQCIYCGSLVYDDIGSLNVPTKQKFNKKIRVSSKGYDDVGAVLTALKIKWEPFNNNFDCDILFLNCLTKDSIDEKKLEKFVKDGGCVYGSCTVSRIFTNAFPNYYNFS
jgi:hypothetical protein